MMAFMAPAFLAFFLNSAANFLANLAFSAMNFFCCFLCSFFRARTLLRYCLTMAFFFLAAMLLSLAIFCAIFFSTALAILIFLPSFCMPPLVAVLLDDGFL